MRIRFYNARILTMADLTAPSIFTGEVWTEDEKILYCGPQDKAPQVTGEETAIDCGGNLLLPGFKNRHDVPSFERGRHAPWRMAEPAGLSL